MRAVLGTCGAAIAGFVMPIAVFVQDAVVMSLLEGVPSETKNCLEMGALSMICLPVAIVILVAGNDALLYVGHDEGVHKVSLALVLLVTISSRAA